MRYPLDKDLSTGKRYPPFEQLGPEGDSTTKERRKIIMKQLKPAKSTVFDLIEIPPKTTRIKAESGKYLTNILLNRGKYSQSHY